MNHNEPQLTAAYMQTLLGEMLAIFKNATLCLLEYTDNQKLQKTQSNIEKYFGEKINFVENNFSEQLQNELNAYFDQKLTCFSTQLSPIGTCFQQKVWQILQTIPYGQTISYKQQSQQYGDHKAIRAIASANGKNPISILIPCHRVIGSNGKLVGYAGGLWRKQKLLAIENVLTSSLF